MRLFLITLLIASFPFIVESSENITINNLKENENISVEFSSSGCFHSITDILEFQGGGVTIYELKQEWSEKEKKLIDLGMKKLGTLQLSKGDIQGLDRLFLFYAGEPNGGCTTVDTIKVKLSRDSKLVKIKEFVDGSCDTYDKKDIVTFGALKRRLEQKRVEQGAAADAAERDVR